MGEFTQKQDGRRYFQGGISGIEGDFSWADGYSSGLKLDIGEAEKDITAFFEFEMIYNGRQTLIVTWHGETLFNELVTQPQVSFAIPCELIEDGIIELEFDYPDAVSPLEINESEVGRILAFAWSKIVFD